MGLVQNIELTNFFNAIAHDERICTMHIALYVVLFELWNENHFVSPFSISRSKVMRMCKMGGKTTYHQHIKDLTAFGYIKYVPSYHPVVGSLVWMV